MKKKSGFTLLELLITVAIISIVMAIAVPSMTTFTKNDRITTNINTLIGHLAYARSEAVKRSQQAVVCVSTSGSQCTSGDWQDGWIVCVDIDSNGSCHSSVDEVIRAKQALDGNNVITTFGGGGRVVYDKRGFRGTDSLIQMFLRDERGPLYGKTLSISNTGRVRLQDG